jgi:2-dehydro-3-deoxy-D-gluconate 5-dehydrogenase
MVLEMFSLEGRVALITGGNGGLGRAIALGFWQAGARVAVTGRNAAKNKRVQADLGESGIVFPLGIRDEAEVDRTIEQVVNQFGQLDILVNNAGSIYVGSVLEHPLAD